MNYLGGMCKNCGSTELLEFDHINPSAKSFTIGASLEISKAKLKIELDKCQLLCTSCHLDKTIAGRGQQRNAHPSLSAYVNNNCRCDDCRTFNREYYRERRAKIQVA